MKFSPTPLHSYSGARAGWDVTGMCSLQEMNEPGLVCSSRFGNDRAGLIVILIFGRPLIGHILTVFIPTTILIVLAHMSKVFADEYVDMVIQVNFTALLVLATL